MAHGLRGVGALCRRGAERGHVVPHPPRAGAETPQPRWRWAADRPACRCGDAAREGEWLAVDFAGLGLAFSAVSTIACGVAQTSPTFGMSPCFAALLFFFPRLFRYLKFLFGFGDAEFFKFCRPMLLSSSATVHTYLVFLISVEGRFIAALQHRHRHLCIAMFSAGEQMQSCLKHSNTVLQTPPRHPRQLTVFGYLRPTTYPRPPTPYMLHRKQSLATLPGVVQVEGAGKTASIFTSAQAVPPTAITPARRPASVCPQQPAGSARLSRQYSSTSQKMAAPVPIRASEMVAPSIWDLANMGGGEGLDNGSSRRGEGAAAGVGSGGQESGAAGQSVSGASSPAGGLRYSGASPADLMGGEGVDVDVDGTAAMLSTSVDSTLFLTEADQQLPGWGSKAAAAATAWPALGSRSRDCSKCGDGAYGGGGSSIGGAWADSADHGGATQGGSDAGVYRQGQGQGQQQVSEPSVVSSHSSTSSFYQCQYGEAGAPKRQKTDSSVGLAGVARPVGQHLQGYASLFGSDASAPSGSSFGGALAYSAYSKLGDLGIGGIGLGDLAGDSFGPSGVDVGSAWVDAVIDSESASSSSPFLLNDK